LLADTPIPQGTIDGQTWTAANSPYIVNGDLKIEDLVIEPGVVVLFSNKYKFEVEGILQAQGFFSDSIYFRPAPTNPNNWEGIKFKNTSVASSLAYCRIEGAVNQGILIEQVHPAIANCLIVNNVGNGIRLKDTSIEIKHCVIRSNTINGVYLDVSQISASNSIIAGNTLNGILSTNGADAITLLNAVIAGNGNIGLSCQKGTLTVKNSIVYDNASQIFAVDRIPNVTYTDVQGTPVFPGTGNINSQPAFENKYSYMLMPQSPCVDAGDPAALYNDRYFPPSLGTARNDMGAYGGPEANEWYPPIYIKPTTVSFGKVTQDSTAAVSAKMYNYRNTGIAVSQTDILGDDFGVFSLDKQTFVIPFSDSLTLGGFFTPDRDMLFEATAVMHTLSHGRVFLPLEGQGIVAKMNILLPELDFGSVAMGNSRSLVLPIRNTGSDTLRLNMTPPGDPAFTLNITSLLIAPGSLSNGISVRFTPAQPATYKDSLIIMSNDPLRSRVTVPVSAQGIGPVIQLDRDSLSFGMISVFSDTIAALTISNTGNRSLVIDGLNITGQDPDNIVFSFSPAPPPLPLTINPGSSRQVSVRFTPLAAVNSTGTLQISSNDPFNPEPAVPLSGTGIAGALTLSPVRLNFNEVGLDSLAVLELTIGNSGADNLIIDSLNITGQDPDSIVFELTGTLPALPAAIVPDGSLTVRVGFAPLRPGDIAAQLVIGYRDPFVKDAHVSMSGTGVAGLLTLSETELNFPGTALDEQSLLNLILSNLGRDDLLIDNLDISGQPPDSIAFELINPLADDLPLKIAPDSSLTIQVGFTPVKTGVAVAQLTILYSDPFSKDTTISLTGTGIAGTLTLSSTSLDFHEVSLSARSVQDLTIGNSGTDYLILDSLNITGQHLDSIAFELVDPLPDLPLTIAPDSSATIQIGFAPVRAGAAEGQLTIRYNNPFNRDTSVTLHGIGIVGALIISDTELDFEQVVLGKQGVQGVTLHNSGDDMLTIDSLQIAGAASDSAAFELIGAVPDLPVSIAPDSALTLQIGFAPLRTGAVTDSLLIRSSDPMRKNATVLLNGTGIAPRIVLSAMAIDFGLIALGSDSAAILRIHNSGIGTLLIPRDSLSITGSQAAAFAIENVAEDLRVQPDDSATITVRFNPGQPGTYLAGLDIRSNDPEEPVATIALSGEGYLSSAVSVSFNDAISSNPFTRGQPATIGFQINGSQYVDSAFVYVRPGGGTDFTRLRLAPQGTNFTAGIDASLVTERGVEYYVHVLHATAATYFPEAGSGLPASVQVSVPEMDFPWQTRMEIYQLISVPLVTDGQLLSTLFGDDLGSYDNTRYRVYDLPDGAAYAEVPKMDKPLPPGKAMWLITKEPRSLNIVNARSAVTDQNFDLPLQAGWNLIASPFAFPIDWNLVSTDLALRYYDGSDWPFVSLLEPFKGYAVMAPGDTILSIPAREANVMTKTTALADLQNFDGWRIQISAESNGARDLYNYAGARRQATSEIDSYDHPEPLPIGEYISVYLAPENSTIKYSTDYREPGIGQYTFEFGVYGNITEQINITFRQENLPDTYEWIVVSEEQGIYYTQKTIRVANKPARFKLIVGTLEFVEGAKLNFNQKPVTYQLEQNFPNPFNPKTNIKFSLPEASMVTMRLYNVVGQKVKSLLEDVRKEAGVYQMEWDGTNEAGAQVASGIYFLHLRAEGYHHFIKMILSR